MWADARVNNPKPPVGWASPGDLEKQWKPFWPCDFHWCSSMACSDGFTWRARILLTCRHSAVATTSQWNSLRIREKKHPRFRIRYHCNISIYLVLPSAPGYQCLWLIWLLMQKANIYHMHEVSAHVLEVPQFWQFWSRCSPWHCNVLQPQKKWKYKICFTSKLNKKVFCK